jgi:hypothetical protein
MSEAMTEARVVPLLFQLKNPDVGLPLSRFQMKPVSRQGIFDIVKAINADADADRKVEEATLVGTFDSLWRKLQAQLDARKRNERELLKEVLGLVRDMARDNGAYMAGISASTIFPHR